MSWPFQRPYPDEIVGSVVLRACIHSGLALKTLRREFLERPDGQMSFFLPSGLPVLARRLEQDPEELTQLHTILPYATAYMRASRARAFLAEAVAPAGAGSADSLHALASAVTRGIHTLRFCQRCLLHDVQRYGEAYWHRTHLLPGMRRCPWHDTVLLEVPAPKALEALNLVRASTGAIAARACPSALPHRRYLDTLARIACESLDPGWSHRDDWAQVYRAAALAKGYASSDNMVASRPLCSDLLQQYGAAYLQAAGCAITGLAERAWPALMVRPGTTVPFTAAKHVLLRAFLECCGSEPKHLGYRPPGKLPMDVAQADCLCSALARRAWEKAQSAQVRLTVKELLESTGMRSAFRHDRHQWPRTAAVLDEFKRSSQAERQIGRRPYWRRRLGLDKELDAD